MPDARLGRYFAQGQTQLTQLGKVPFYRCSCFTSFKHMWSYQALIFGRVTFPFSTISFIKVITCGEVVGGSARYMFIYKVLFRLAIFSTTYNNNIPTIPTY